MSINASIHSHLDDELFGGPETWRLVITSLACFGITAVSVAAGIGGGGLLVPLYSVVLDLGPRLAVPVSKATIFGVALGNAAIITRKRHPTAPRPLVDYSLAVLMQAGVLMGIVFGVILNLVLPEIGIVVLLGLVLGFNAYKTLKKGRAKFRDESESLLMASAASSEVSRGRRPSIPTTEMDLSPFSRRPPPPSTSASAASAASAPSSSSSSACSPPPSPPLPPEVVVLPPIGSPLPIEASAADATATDRLAAAAATTAAASAAPSAPPTGRAGAAMSAAMSAKLLSSINGSGGGAGDAKCTAESAQFPPWAYASLLGMIGFLVLYSLLLNGHLDDSIGPCHPLYWALYCLPVPVYSCCLVAFAMRNRARHAEREAAGVAYEAGEIRWTRATTLLLPPVAVCSGVMSGMLGIGGGMILGPLFLELDLHPQVLV